jgi:hypothetical protein
LVKKDADVEEHELDGSHALVRVQRDKAHEAGCSDKVVERVLGRGELGAADPKERVDHEQEQADTTLHRHVNGIYFHQTVFVASPA